MRIVKRNGIKWEHFPNDHSEAENWQTPWATVWSNGVWHTWDRNGTGGENDIASSVYEAMDRATLAALRQGFVRLVRAE